MTRRTTDCALRSALAAVVTACLLPGCAAFGPQTGRWPGQVPYGGYGQYRGNPVPPSGFDRRPSLEQEEAMLGAVEEFLERTESSAKSSMGRLNRS